MGYFNGNSLSLDSRSTSRLMKESDTPESSTAKCVVFPKTTGKNSNGIGAVGSGTTFSTKEEAFPMHPSRGGALLLVIGLNSSINELRFRMIDIDPFLDLQLEWDHVVQAKQEECVP